MDKKPVIGLALGGIGGFNAHDAGVLAAAHDCDLRPDAITCASGAIIWTHLYLTDPEALGDEVQRQADGVGETNALRAAMMGNDGMFHPAYQSYWRRWFQPASATPFQDLLDRLWPAQLYESTRPPAFYETIAGAFRAATIPIMFNAYGMASGRELVFCNEAAFAFLGRHPDEIREHDIPGEDMSTQYRSIDAEAVRAALWLTFYGFSNRCRDEIAIDGAYQRQLILSELTGCDVIYAIKPQASTWRSQPPGNVFEVQDFTTEMWFNTSFAAEVAGLRAGTKRNGRQEPIRVEPICLRRPMGFFNYFVEKVPNYQEGYQQATKLFTRDLATAAGRARRNGH